MAEMEIEYRPVETPDYERVRQLFSEAGWSKGLADAARFEAMLKGADRTVVACEDGRVVGFARAICDGAYNGYISTVAVARDRRGRGIGRELIRRLVGDDTHITWVLRAGHGSEGFWEKMGFRSSEVAMEKVRTSN